MLQSQILWGMDMRKADILVLVHICMYASWMYLDVGSAGSGNICIVPVLPVSTRTKNEEWVRMTIGTKHL